MSDPQVQGNKLLLSNHEVGFDFEIREVKKLADRLIVLLGIPFHINSYNNLYALSTAGEILWRVESPAPALAGKMRLPYEYLDITPAGKIAVTDFYGRRFLVDPDSGRVLSLDIVK